MSTPGMDAIDFAIARATAAGALHCIRTEQTFIEDGGIRFLVRWASTLALKDVTRKPATATPANPFLPPEPALTLGAVGPQHLLVLNKFPVIERHLLIVTREFEEQSAPLTPADFDALGGMMSSLGGLGFYNGGTEAGASQRHKHLQWIPESPQSDCLRSMTAALPTGCAPLTLMRHPQLVWRHAFIRLGHASSGAELTEAFTRGATHCALRAADGSMPPYNFLANDEWMLVVPRRQERCEGISVNALGFAGSMFVRTREDIEKVREIGPLALLAAVATP
jgi:sulfate adenylyltransferase (ADP) / ATP adenylyltransferase